MPLIGLINQPFSGKHGDVLVSILDSGRYSRLRLAVAFARSSGVLELGDAFERFRSAGGAIEVYVGVDMAGTSYEALCALLQLVDALTIVHATSPQTFHSKIYCFESKDEANVIIGSANLTAGGLWRNVESSMTMELDLSNANDFALLSSVNKLFEHLENPSAHPMTLKSVNDIDSLLSFDLVCRERSLHASARAHSKMPTPSPFTKYIGPSEIEPVANEIRVGDGNRFRTIVETCNALLGTNYKGMQRAFFKGPFRNSGRDDYAAWFPIMHIDGVTEPIEEKNGWRNDLDLSSGEIVETPLSDKAKTIAADDPTHDLTRVVFARDVREKLPFFFAGIFRFEREDEAGRFVYRQVSSVFRPLSPRGCDHTFQGEKQ